VSNNELYRELDIACDVKDDHTDAVFNAGVAAERARWERIMSASYDPPPSVTSDACRAAWHNAINSLRVIEAMMPCPDATT